MLSRTPSLHHNFPPQVTTFIGREHEIQEGVQKLENPTCRLLTLVGLGGIGKTRLSFEIAKQVASQFPDGLWYVPLAPLEKVSDIVPTLIHVLGIVVGESDMAFQQVINYLSRRKLLLIIDNFEHVLAGSDLIPKILQHAPDVKIMVTSREALLLREEWVQTLRGLPFPMSEVTTADESYDAIKLFYERAQQIHNTYEKQDLYTNVVRICQLVEGMPLAIELAVSWLRTLIPAEIVQEIERNIAFLTTRVTNIPEQHRSIQAIFEHSWHLCTSEEQFALCRLSVFHDGFTRVAAKGIAGAGLHTLSALVDKSLIRVSGKGRYDMQKLLQQYAATKLKAARHVTTTRQAHLTFFADFLAERTPDIKGQRQLEGLNEIEADFENIRAAWHYAVETEQLQTLYQMAEGLALYCDLRARYQDGLTMFEHGLSLVAPDLDHDSLRYVNRIRARWIHISLLFEKHTKVEAFEYVVSQIELCLRTARTLDDTETIGLVLWLKGESKRIVPEIYNLQVSTCLDAMPSYEEATDLFTTLDDPYYLGRILRGQVCVTKYIEDKENPERSRILNLAHLDLTQKIGDLSGYAHAICYKSLLTDTLAAKEKYIREAYEIWLQMGDGKSVGLIGYKFSTQVFLEGEFEVSAQLIQDALPLLMKVGWLADWHLAYRALIFTFCDYDSSPYQLTSELLDGMIYRPSVIYDTPMHACIACVLFALKNEGAQHYLMTALQRAHEADQPDVMIGCLAMVAVYLAQLDEPHAHQQAIQVFGLVSTYQDTPTLGWIDKWDRIALAQKQLRSNLGDETYASLWEQGTQLDLIHTIEDLIKYFTDANVVGTSDSEVDVLTSRELEVLELLAQHECDRRIVADNLTITRGTLRTHISHIYSKLDAKNCSQAVLKARRVGLI